MSQLFRVTVAKGLEDLLLHELQSLSIPEVKQNRGVIEFEGELDDACRVCLYSRIASRVIMPVCHGVTENEDQFYSLVQSVNWNDHIDATQTLAIDAVINHSFNTNSHYVALKAKDAIVDQFKEQFNSRPNIEKQQPDLRLHVYTYRNETTVSIDLSGDPLNKRGYRVGSVLAPLKESLAAAILMRANWPKLAAEGRVLLDPMCGSGTFLVEAAFMAANIAPNVLRTYYGFINWKGHQPDNWEQMRQQALDHYHQSIENNSIPVCYGSDDSAESIAAAKKNAQASGMAAFIKLKQQSVFDCLPPVETEGLLVTNPPYGERLGDVEELRFLYSDFGDVLKSRFAGWQVSIFSCNEKLLQNVALRSFKSNSFFNGPLKCRLNHYQIRNEVRVQQSISVDNLSEQAITLKNRLQKNLKHLAKWARKQQVDCYRIYDADIPEYAFAVDKYADYYHVQEYKAPMSVDISKVKQRQQEMRLVLELVLDCDAKQLVFKTRQKQKGENQYEKQQSRKHFMTVTESGLNFEINLTDYLDTGLFLDHRMVRQHIRELSQGKSFLNLFAYTGTASVYAAAAGASSVTTVDMSKTYLDWAKQNFAANQLQGRQYQFIQADCIEWLKSNKSKYDLIFLDPPTFSNSKRMQSSFDIQRDHVFLIKQCVRCLNKGGILIFSNNMKRFKLDADALESLKLEIRDLTRQTMPEDFSRPKQIHHVWQMSRRP